jgi:hypothetical protein
VCEETKKYAGEGQFKELQSWTRLDGVVEATIIAYSFRSTAYFRFPVCSTLEYQALSLLQQHESCNVYHCLFLNLFSHNSTPFTYKPHSAAQRRTMSSSTDAWHKATTKQAGFAKTWLTDPATYPIIGVLTIAMTGVVGFISYKFTYCPEVRITSGAKGEVLRTWVK